MRRIPFKVRDDILVLHPGGDEAKRGVKKLNVDAEKRKDVRVFKLAPYKGLITELLEGGRRSVICHADTVSDQMFTFRIFSRTSSSGSKISRSTFKQTV